MDALMAGRARHRVGDRQSLVVEQQAADAAPSFVVRFSGTCVSHNGSLRSLDMRNWAGSGSSSSVDVRSCRKCRCARRGGRCGDEKRGRAFAAERIPGGHGDLDGADTVQMSLERQPFALRPAAPRSAIS